MKENNHSKAEQSSVTAGTSAEETRHHNYCTTIRLRGLNYLYRNTSEAVNLSPEVSEAKKTHPPKLCRPVKSAK